MFSDADFSGWVRQGQATKQLSAEAAMAQARASQTSATGQAELHHAQAGVVAPTAESEQALRASQGGYYNAAAADQNAQARTREPLAASEAFEHYGRGNAALGAGFYDIQRGMAVPGQSASEMDLHAAQAAAERAHANQTNVNSGWWRYNPAPTQTAPTQTAPTQTAPAPTAPTQTAPAASGGARPPSIGSGGLGIGDVTLPGSGIGDLIFGRSKTYGVKPRGYAEGASNITAPGDGTVDTTKANLANGEAVLNKGAAEHLGRPVIQALNAVGAARMGMVPGKSTQDDRVKPANAAQTAGKAGAQGYAKGTSKAGPKGGGKAPAKPDSKPSPKAAKSGGAAPSDTPSLDQIDPKMLAAALQMGAMGQPQAPQQATMLPQGAPGGSMGMM